MCQVNMLAILVNVNGNAEPEPAAVFAAKAQSRSLNQILIDNHI